MSLRFPTAILPFFVALTCACTPDHVGGLGMEAFLSVRPQQIAFGNTSVGRQRTASVELVNMGQVPLSLRFAIEGEPTAVFAVEQDQLQLGVGGIERVGLVFRPERAQQVGASLTIADLDQPDVQATVLLSGAGLLPTCDDDNPCTDDSFDLDLQVCQYTQNNRACDDNRRCTSGDFCLDGFCSGQPVICDDGVACTIDVCDEDRGCVALPDDTACSNGSDLCAVGVCDAELGCVVEAAPDGTFCGVSDCVEALYCVTGECRSGPATDGVPCEDDDPCTEGDTCRGGECRSGDVLVCDTAAAIAALRAMPDGPVDVTLRRVYVTYVRNNGYFLQASRTGPALFYYTGDTDPNIAVGNMLTMHVTEMYTYHDARQIGEATVVSNDNGSYDVVANLAQDLTAGSGVILSDELEYELVVVPRVTVVSGAVRSWEISYGSGPTTAELYAYESWALGLCVGARLSIGKAIVGNYDGSYTIRSYWHDDISNLETGDCPDACGNGEIEGAEVCDDGDQSDSDSCLDGRSALCQYATCGDGYVWNTDGGQEECDDANDVVGDGCDDNCVIDDGWECTHQPSNCAVSSCLGRVNETPCVLQNGSSGHLGVCLNEACDCMLAEYLCSADYWGFWRCDGEAYHYTSCADFCDNSCPGYEFCEPVPVDDGIYPCQCYEGMCDP